MTPAEASEVQEQINLLIARMRSAFPCVACKSSGESGSNGPYPTPCTVCFGKGYDVPWEEFNYD